MPSDQHVQRAMEIADIINSNAPLGVRVAKEAGRKFIEQEAIAAAGLSAYHQDANKSGNACVARNHAALVKPAVGRGHIREQTRRPSRW